MGVCDALNPLLEAWKADLNTFSLRLLLNPAKEVLVGFGKSIGTVLENLRVNTCKLGIRGFGFFENVIKIGSAMKRNLLRFVGYLASIKKKIVEFATKVELRKEPILLFLRRIQSIVVVPQCHSYILTQKTLIQTQRLFCLFYPWFAFKSHSYGMLFISIKNRNTSPIKGVGFPTHNHKF